MQNYLYKCEICGVASCFKEDHGEIWFRDCGSCRSLQFHHKVIIVRTSSLQEVGQFYCQTDKEEEDVNKEKG